MTGIHERENIVSTTGGMRGHRQETVFTSVVDIMISGVYLVGGKCDFMIYEDMTYCMVRSAYIHVMILFQFFLL